MGGGLRCAALPWMDCSNAKSMKTILKRAHGAVLALAGALVVLSGCASNPHYVADGPRFHDEAAASLIVRYSSENTVFMLRPDGHEGPFQRIFSREELCGAVAGQPGERGLAVVIINHYRMRDLEQQAEQRWVESLNRLNYRRVVFLRGNGRGNINGLRIVSETLLAGPTPAPVPVRLIARQ